MNLVPLYEQAIQFNDYNGTVLAAGKVEVWYLGRTRKADIYSDVAGETPLPNPLDLNDLGMQEVYVNPAFNYTLVVYDPYGSELFSVDKYLQGAGAHTTSNVVVQPSEHIGVSAWTVGEVQIYQPYLTGQLGKVYTGIEPIVVNNVEDKISAQHVPLGVQDPLYFVQDDEEACIIGCSAQTEIPSELSGKWDEASDAVITNSAQWAEGTEYEAGSYVDITNNTISVTGLTPVPADTASTGLVAQVSADITALIPDTSDMATQTWVNEQEFLTAHQDISNKLDTTAFSTVSGDFLTAIPSEYVTENTLQSGLSSKLDSTAFSTVSGNFLTAHQSLDGLMSADLLEISDNKITGYNGTAFAGQGGGGVTGDFELKEGNGIQLTDDPIAQTTTISVSGDYATNTQLQNVSGEITALIPSTAGLATEDWVTGQGYITNDAITGKQDITGMTAYQSAGDYLTTGDSANFLLTSDSGNFYPSDNPSAFITGVDLTPYQLTADMTAYQPAGDYLTTADSANFYTTANTAGYISEVPDTYLQNTDLSTEDGKVTAISGIPLSAGGDVPEGVMVESGLEYNAVNEISAYNGSAIAQYGAEKQFIVHDDTLCHLSNSAQYAIGVQVPNVAKLMGVDETVLWSGTPDTTAYNMTLSDNLNNYNYFAVIWKSYQRVYRDCFVANTTAYPLMLGAAFVNTDGNYEKSLTTWATTNGLTYNWKATIHGTFTGNQSNQWRADVVPLEIHGIGKKA